MASKNFENLLEIGAIESLEKVINPFISGKINSDKFDQKKLSLGIQLITNYRAYLASKMHDKGLNLMAIKMIAGDDKDTTKELIIKHFDEKLKLPQSTK